ncbi:MAG TPA: permease-like cell division protein FtsX [Candidatus Micrarchaeia archaeon]|nr:permease-like cell division protein FtsX [Candidatus Micrarchaeia archaeon]
MNPFPAIRFVLRSALQNVVRNLGISLASLLTVTLTLLGAGGAVVVVHALDAVLHSEESQASVLKVFLADHVSLQSIVELETQLAGQRQVVRAQFESKDAAARQACHGLGLCSALNTLRSTGGGNPLPASLNLKLRNISAVTTINNEVRTSPLIFQGAHPTDYNPDVIPRLERYILIAQIAGAVLVAVIGAVALVIITISIRTAAYVRRREIEIMKLVGASEWFIRWPFIFEGMIIGIASAVVAAGILIGVEFLFGSGHALFLGIGLHFALVVIAGLLVAGALLGGFGSMVGIRRSLAV